MFKILIISNNYKIGGIQKALLNMLSEINNDYEISLLVFNPEGEYKNLIPDNIKIIESNKFLRLLACDQEEAKKMGFFWLFLRSIFVLWSRVFSNRIPHRVIFSTYRILGGFDYAISYVHSLDEKKLYFGCNEFTIKRVQSIKKAAFIHCDFSMSSGNTDYNRKIYRKFDKIVTVSESGREKFISILPELENKTFSIRNFNNYEEILREMNRDSIIYDNNFINIVTISRLSEEKGIERCISIFRELHQLGYQFKWHIIGGGPLKDEISELIINNNLTNLVVLYGNQINPYRFLVNADLFFLPSYHEAAPMVFDEAKFAKVPILTTNTMSAVELITKDGSGWVCENNQLSIKESLKFLLDNPDELSRVKIELSKKKFNNDWPRRGFKNVFN